MRKVNSPNGLKSLVLVVEVEIYGAIVAEHLLNVAVDLRLRRLDLAVACHESPDSCHGTTVAGFLVMRAVPCSREMSPFVSTLGGANEQGIAHG